MNLNNSKIDLIAYQGKNLPAYSIDGKIENERIKATITNSKGDFFGEITGIFHEESFFFRLEFYKHKYRSLDVFGKLNEDPQNYSVKINNIPVTCDIKGKLGEKVNLEVLMLNSDGIAGFTLGGTIAP
ncbi:hypothetical protein HZA97_02655 [Candidatus Woesearchaeota archaeon]|nr:hypothetical protein [Candidatus Woesearchaeota archaeon]